MKNRYWKTKKLNIIFLVITLMFGLSGCGSEGSNSKMQSGNSVQDTINQQIASEQGDVKPEEQTTKETTELVDATEATTEATTAPTATPPTAEVDSDSLEDYSSEDADIDLTLMKSDMIYATVYQLMYDAHSYEGKKIKMKGAYYVGVDEENGIYYHFVLIKDATACCQQGMEFIWEDGTHVYPDDYPEDGTEVIVTGIFETYKDNPEDVYEYCRLKDATMEVIQSE